MLAWGSDPLSNPVWPLLSGCEITHFVSNGQRSERFFLVPDRQTVGVWRRSWSVVVEQVRAESACTFEALCEFPLFDFGLMA